MATITPVLWKSKKNKKGEHPIYIRIEAAGSRLYFSTSLAVKPRHWNSDSGEVRKTHVHYEEMNGLITMHRQSAEKAELQLKLKSLAVTPEAIKAALRPPKATDIDFIAFGNAYAEEMRKRGQIPTSNRYFSASKRQDR